MQTAVREGRAEDERWHLRKDGSRFRASGVMTPMRNDGGALIGFAKVMRDVTERERAREELETSLRDKTMLLREVHHRVKNNLQVIVSLINLQTSHVNDPRVIGMFEETQNRVRAIATIHERLYSTDDLASVHFGMHLDQLARHLWAFYGMEERIQLDIDTADVALDIDQAIPLALISNELLCNAFKHAFPDERRGLIFVRLRYIVGEASQHAGELEISDNGIGIPDTVDIRTAQSMGFHLVRILTEQLHASPTVTRQNGTCVRVRFSIRDE
jgi:two-component sensor histidine kinase